MKLSLLYEINVPMPWGGTHPYGQREAEQRQYANVIEQIKLADQVGFHTTWHVEHHFREGRSHCPAPECVLGALSQVTEQIRLGFGVTLLPYGFGHPARVAERVATIDVLSKGRVEWGMGRSTPMEQQAFHVNPETSRAETFAAAQQIVEMWESEYYECHDEFLDFPKRMVTPKPFQDPHPSPWMAAVSQGSAAAAGRNGVGLLSFAILLPLTPDDADAQAEERAALARTAGGEWSQQDAKTDDALQTTETVAGQIAEYRAAAENPEPITRVANNRVGVYTLAHCVDSMEKAEADYGVWKSVNWWYQSMASFAIKWDMAHLPEEERKAAFPQFGKDMDPTFYSKQNMIVVGNPDECYEKMERYAKLGVDELICNVEFGYLPHESIMRSIELLGTKVAPALADL